LVQQQWHHGRERHQPDEHQRLGYAAAEHRAPGVPNDREIPAGQDGNQNYYNLTLYTLSHLLHYTTQKQRNELYNMSLMWVSGVAFDLSMYWR